MMWVLDDGPFGLLAREFDPTWEWPAPLLHVVDAVATNASRDKFGRRQALLDAQVDGAACVEVHSIAADSETAAFVYDHLRPDEVSATRDLGEDASIAFCAVEAREAVFVSADKPAAYLGLCELGAHASRPPSTFGPGCETATA